jgi:hypothetical protein
MHLAPEGIESAEIARAIRIHADGIVAGRKNPRLGVVRIGGEDRCMQRAAIAVQFEPAPLGIALSTGKNTAIPYAIAEACK